MSESLPYDESEFDKNVILENLSNTLDDSDIGCLVETDLNYFVNVKVKTKCFAGCPGNKISLQNNFSDYMIDIKPSSYTQNKTLKCDLTGGGNYLIKYWSLKFYVRQGMIVDNVHEVIFLRQSKSLEKLIIFKNSKKVSNINWS